MVPPNGDPAPGQAIAPADASKCSVNSLSMPIRPARPRFALSSSCFYRESTGVNFFLMLLQPILCQTNVAELATSLTWSIGIAGVRPAGGATHGRPGDVPERG